MASGVMGDVAAAAVLVAVLVAITFTPALLGLMGMRVLNKKMRASAAWVKTDFLFFSDGKEC